MSASELAIKWELENKLRAVTAERDRLLELLDHKGEGGGETVGDTLIRLSKVSMNEDWRAWMREFGKRINQTIKKTQ